MSSTPEQHRRRQLRKYTQQEWEAFISPPTLLNSGRTKNPLRPSDIEDCVYTGDLVRGDGAPI